MKIYNAARYIQTELSYDEDKKEYHFQTNAHDNWGSRDEVAFAYEKYDFSYGERSTLIMETAITSFVESENHASVGLMIRGDDVPEAANAFLLIRRNTVFLTFRTTDGTSTHSYRSVIAGGLRYPLYLKLELTGSMATGSYRLSETEAWQKVGAVQIGFGTQVLAGIAGYSYVPDYPITATLRDYCVTHVNRKPVEVSASDSKRELPPDTLYFEDFEKGVVNTNPRNGFCWTEVTCANIVETEAADGGHTCAWFKDHMDGIHFVGSRKWADYAFSMDVKFPANIATEDSNTLVLFVRHREMDFYGRFHYGVFFTGGNRLEIRKAYASAQHVSGDQRVVAQTSFSYLEGLGKWHHLRLDVFDNTITVFWDEKEILRYVDSDPFICPVGKVGFMTENAAVYLDNISVRELEDPLGGAYDNLVGGLWDQPTPANFVYSYDEAEHQSSYISDTKGNCTTY